ncbi:phosphatase PAP2 family protein [Microvirga roseola]|uniref:phosphatase PAP2 family protein n=1 Tax=Microvirga roseola TaxID=2883126 RepID=UPI001E3A35F5|nr:phosphatase PAP2 family protein [Microvirga roseola]
MQVKSKMVISALLQRTKQCFWKGWQDLDPSVRRRWFVLTGVGFAFACSLMAALSLIGQHLEQVGALSWERNALLWLEAHLPLPLSSAVWAQAPGYSHFIIPLLVLAAGWSAWTYRPLQALSVVVGYVGIKLIVQVGWTVWHRERPDDIANGLLSPGFLNAFPSGHAAQTVFCYGLLAAFWFHASASRAERALAVLCVVLLQFMVVAGRIRMGAHWPSDILAGTLIGAAWLAAVLIALHRSRAS